MKTNIQLYSYYRSSCSHRVRIALYLKNIPFQYIPVHLLKEEQKTEQYKKLNPEGQVPCLVNKGVALTQTMAILQYLDGLHPRPALFPKAYKAQIISVCEIINSGIQPLQNLKVLRYLKSQGLGFTAKKWPGFWIREGLLAVEKKAQELKQGPFFFGCGLTAVELFIIPQLQSARRFNVHLRDFPRLLEIEGLCLQMPAFKKAHPSAQPDHPLNRTQQGSSHK